MKKHSPKWAELKTPDRTNDIYEACLKDDLKRVSEIFNSTFHFDLNVINETSGQSPLHLAVQNGNMKLVKMLVQKGANTNLLNSNQATPLHLACIVGKCEIVKFLVFNGADISIKSKYESTPLHWAAREGYLSIVQFLFQRGVSLEEEDVFGSRPVFWAAQGGHVDMMEYFSREGQSFKVLNRKGLAPMHIACRRGNLRAVNYLLNEGVDVETGSEKPVYLRGDSVFVLTPQKTPQKWELAEITEVMRKNRYRLTVKSTGKAVEAEEVGLAKTVCARPLHLATQQLRGEVVRTLLDHGAHLHARDHHLKTPLHYASKAGTVAVLSELLRAGAALEDIDAFGQTPLFVACRHGEVGAAEVLLLHGSKIPVAGIQNGEWVRFKKSISAEKRTLIKDLIWNAGPGGKNLAGKLRQLQAKISYIQSTEQGSNNSSGFFSLGRTKGSKDSMYSKQSKGTSREGSSSYEAYESFEQNRQLSSSFNSSMESPHLVTNINRPEGFLGERVTLSRNNDDDIDFDVLPPRRGDYPAVDCSGFFGRMLCLSPRSPRGHRQEIEEKKKSTKVL